MPLPDRNLVAGLRLTRGRFGIGCSLHLYLMFLFPLELLFERCRFVLCLVQLDRVGTVCERKAFFKFATLLVCLLFLIGQERLLALAGFEFPFVRFFHRLFQPDPTRRSGNTDRGKYNPSQSRCLEKEKTGGSQHHTQNKQSATYDNDPGRKNFLIQQPLTEQIKI